MVATGLSIYLQYPNAHYKLLIMNFYYGSDDSSESSWDFTPVSFYRPDGDIEEKDVGWCKSNGFFQIEGDLWSGPWYYRHFPDERPEVKMPHLCPICKVKLSRFKTETELNRHIRMQGGKAHDAYRKKHNIKFGPTEEEKEVKEKKIQASIARRKREERAELLDTIYGGFYPEYMVQDARRRLKAMEEEEERLAIEKKEADYEYPCLYRGCSRRFQTEEELAQHTHCLVKECHKTFDSKEQMLQHLCDSKGKGHKNALNRYEQDFQHPCNVKHCKRRFETEEMLKDHLQEYHLLKESHRDTVSTKKKRGKQGKGNAGHKKGHRGKGRGATSNHITTNMTEEEELDRYYASVDVLYDGAWLYDIDGMMIHFVDECFESELIEEWEDELEDHQENGTPIPKWEDEFVELDMRTIETVLLSLHQRGLHLASGVSRFLLQAHITDYFIPSIVRITKLDEEFEMKELLSKKKKGNLLFSAKKYQEAANMYEEALMSVLSNLYVTPQEQIKEVINVMSNAAECYLRLEEYDNVGNSATKALLLDSGHVKSRIRRAKAELAIFKQKHSLHYLVQACDDLEDVLKDPDPGPNGLVAIETAQNLLNEANELLEHERRKMAEEQPDNDFDFLVRLYKSKCF